MLLSPNDRFLHYQFIDSRNYNQEGYGEFGFQMTMSTRPARIIVTAPGSFYFRGKSISSIDVFVMIQLIYRRYSFTSTSPRKLGRY